MSVEQMDKKSVQTLNKDEQKKLSPRERILQRYGFDKQGNMKNYKPRSINELFDMRQKERFR